MLSNAYGASSSFQLQHEPVAIISVDTNTKMVKGLTRVRVPITIDCNYPVGGMYILPATGEQWYVDRLNEVNWRLVSRIPFNDDNTLLEPVPGQMIVGSTGPVVVNGSQMDVHGDTTINGTLTVGGLPAVRFGDVPTTETSPGTQGMAACDGAFFYFCTDDDTWIRVAVTPW